MKIGLDLRLLKSGEYYSTFIIMLLEKLLITNTEHTYVLYLNTTSTINFSDSVDKCYIKSHPGSFSEHFMFARTLKKAKNDIVIFFNEKKPLGYQGKYILCISSLKEIHYHTKATGIKKIYEHYILNSALKGAQKVICFESSTKGDLNEKLNIPEQKIKIVSPFFTKGKVSSRSSIGNIKTKYAISGEYLIYSGGNGNHKNLTRLLEVFKKLEQKKININLVILDKDVTKDLVYREDTIKTSTAKQVFYVGSTTPEEKKDFYKQALGTIFPSLYESFPFDLTEALTYNSPILSSSIPAIREIMGSSVSYFSPIRSNDIVEAIENFAAFKENESHYNDIFKQYTPEKTVKQLLETINSI